MSIALFIKTMSEYVVGFPLIFFVITVSIICTIAFKGIQFSCFFTAWKETLFPTQKATTSLSGDMTPGQAFINTINTGLGNGSIAGMATAIYAGGPGAIFWVVIFGFLLMSVRFFEVYTSTLYGARAPKDVTIGGPMLYLNHAIGGKILAKIYAFFCLFFGLLIGNAMQANSIKISIATTWGVTPLTIAIILTAFVIYVTCGDASRIVQVSYKIVPIKVIVFFGASIALLTYHSAHIIDALTLIIKSAFTSTAISGGTIGFSVQQAIKLALIRSIVSTEAGLGTAAILFGFTGSNDPMRSGLMGMLSTFISTLVCFIVGLCIVASGVWNSGLNSTALTIAAFKTLFGQYGGWIVSFLSITFGIGLLVTFAYIARVVFLFLTKDRFAHVFPFLYCLFCFGGAMLDADIIWSAGDLVNGLMLFINLFGLLCLLPRISKDVATKQC